MLTLGRVAHSSRAADNLIQRAIREHLSDRTLLTVAHRLSSIMDYDLILVMDKGQVAEYGTPRELIAKRGEFAALVAAHHEQMRQQLKQTNE